MALRSCKKAIKLVSVEADGTGWIVRVALRSDLQESLRIDELSTTALYEGIAGLLGRCASTINIISPTDGHIINMDSAGDGDLEGMARLSKDAAVEEDSEATEAALARQRFFDFLDADCNARISLIGWEQAFDKMDDDHDGTISRKEWFLHQGTSHLFDAIPRKELACISRSEWLNCFKALDKDADGNISPEDWSFSSALAVVPVVAPVVVDPKVAITVQGISGDAKCTITADRDWNVAALKRAIATECDIGLIDQKLVMGSRELKNSEQLKLVCQSEATCTVTLVRLDGTHAASSAIGGFWKSRMSKRGV